MKIESTSSLLKRRSLQEKQSKTLPESKPKVRIIHIVEPEIVKATVSNFKETVQRLTGKQDHHHQKGHHQRLTGKQDHHHQKGHSRSYLPRVSHNNHDHHEAQLQGMNMSNGFFMNSKEEDHHHIRNHISRVSDHNHDARQHQHHEIHGMNQNNRYNHDDQQHHGMDMSHGFGINSKEEAHHHNLHHQKSQTRESHYSHDAHQHQHHEAAHDMNMSNGYFVNSKEEDHYYNLYHMSRVSHNNHDAHQHQQHEVNDMNNMSNEEDYNHYNLQSQSHDDMSTSHGLSINSEKEEDIASMSTWNGNSGEYYGGFFNSLGYSNGYIPEIEESPYFPLNLEPDHYVASSSYLHGGVFPD